MSEQYNTIGGVVAQQINSNCILRITTREENYLGRDRGSLNTQSNSYEMVCSAALSALSALPRIPQITQIPQIPSRDSSCDSATPRPMVRLVPASPALPPLVCSCLFPVVLLLLI
jgi:hypothetical protein